MLNHMYSPNRFPTLRRTLRRTLRSFVSCTPFSSEEDALSSHLRGIEIFVEDKGYFYRLTENGVRRNWRRAQVLFGDAPGHITRDTTLTGQAQKRAKIFEAFDPAI